MILKKSTDKILLKSINNQNVPCTEAIKPKSSRKNDLLKYKHNNPPGQRGYVCSKFYFLVRK